MNWTFSGTGQTGFVVQQRTTYFYRAAATNILGTGALSNSQSILTK